MWEHFDFYLVTKTTIAVKNKSNNLSNGLMLEKHNTLFFIIEANF